MFREAPAPAKAHNSFLLSLGLVNIPLAVLSGTEETRVKRSEFFDGDVTHQVGRQAYDKATGEPVEQHHIVRMAEATNGTWVALSDDEIALATMPKGVAEVIAFVPVAKLSASYVTEKIDQVRAKTSGLKVAQRAAAERSFALFLAGLKANKVVALIKVALRGPARYAAITCDGDMLLLYPADAIRQPAALTTVTLSEQELTLMSQLISFYPKAAPVILDDTAATVQTYVDAKAAANGVAPVGNVSAQEPINDLVQALLDSLKAPVTA